MDLCRLGTDERATGPHPAQKMTSARFREFAKHFNAFHCSTRCVRCAKSVPHCAVKSGDPGRSVLEGIFQQSPWRREHPVRGRNPA